MKKRHIYFYNILRPLVTIFAKIKFDFHYKKAENLPDNYIVLSNHVTDYDMLFVASSFPRHMYFIASEHIARRKTLFKFLQYIQDPIMRYKGTVAGAAVIEALRKIKAGASVCIFAEGIRTWDGVTCPILPSTGKMIKSARCGLVTYKLTGGYFASPGWSDKGIRKGPVYGAPVNVYTKEQIASMSVDEINEIINRDLYEDAYERQIADPKKYTGSALAEGLENLFYICPCCNSIDTLTSEGNTLKCNSCEKEFIYNEYGLFEQTPFKTVREYSLWQTDKTADLVKNNITLTASKAVLQKIVKHDETLIADGNVSITPELLTCVDSAFPIASINNMDITGRHGLVFSVGKDYYELKVPGNALKFLLYYRAVKNM